jgi:hypothetical protein
MVLGEWSVHFRLRGLISFATSLVVTAGDDLDTRLGLISSHPRENLGSAAQLVGSFYIAASVLMNSDKEASRVRVHHRINRA